MTRPIGCGIDFGTSNSSIAVASADDVQVISVTTGTLPECLPSIIYIDRGAQRDAGLDAVQQYLITGSNRTLCGGCSLGPRRPLCKQFRPGGGCLDARLISGVKQDLTDTRFEFTHSWATNFDIPEFVAIVMARLKRTAENAVGAPIDRAVLGYPVAFAGAEGPDFETRQDLALRRLEEGAQRAGFHDLEIYPEPAAAVIAETIARGNLLSVDFGGGTFDAAIIQFDDSQGEIVAMKGAAIGGQRFDRKIFEYAVAGHLGWSSFPGRIQQSMTALSEVRHLMTDPEAMGIISQSKDPGAQVFRSILLGGHAYTFYHAIEKAKIELSSKPQTSIEFHRPGIDLSIPITRSDYEQLIERDLDVVAEAIDATMKQAGVQAADVDVVIRTGGTSGTPMFVRYLESVFGTTKIEKRKLFASVCEGLAMRAQQLWT